MKSTSLALLFVATLFIGVADSTSTEEKYHHMRHLYTKSHGKSSKASKTICLVTADYNEVEGSREAITGEWVDDEVCKLDTAAKSQACLYEQFGYSSPFAYNRDSKDDVIYQFVDGGSPASINNSTFCGTVPPTAPNASSITLEYMNVDLNNMNVSNIEYIEYDYKCVEREQVDACLGTNMRLNIYTRTGLNSNSADWYDCRLDFAPASVDRALSGDWGTFRISSADEPYGFVQRAGNCPSGVKSLDNLGGNDYILGTGSQLIVFLWNVGTSDGTDKGMEGYYDSIRIKLKDETNVIFYDL